ncbi:MAG: type II and III secretion system protein family protein [Alphaproteobacteria bacterium]|nr:type II and III secretion system protein family protein [Alphaproteobacteria bacterium]
MHKIQRAMWVTALAVLSMAVFTVSDAYAQQTYNGRHNIGLELTEGILVRLDRPADAVFVADTEIADLSVKSPTLIYIRGIAAGKTNLFAVDSEDEVITELIITLSHNISELERALRIVTPNSQIRAQSVGKNLVLTGIAHSARDVANAMELATGLAEREGDEGSIINQIYVDMPNQVNLRVKIAEVSRETIKRLGFDFGLIADITTDLTLAVATGGSTAVLGAGGGALGSDIGSGFYELFFSDGDVLASSVIDALERQNLLTVLAEPNLTALSGHTASFLAGGEFPIPVPQRQGEITIEFREFGVALEFTPIVLDSGRISLRVATEVSTLSDAGSVTLGSFVIPALATRRTDTTVELASGQSMAIAGLLQNNINETISDFPGLADIPILGTLFRSSRFENNETELVILVTPYLVRPVSTVALANPVQGVRPTNDYERAVEGRLFKESQPTAARAPVNGVSQGLVGPVGFVLD